MRNLIEFSRINWKINLNNKMENLKEKKPSLIDKWILWQRIMRMSWKDWKMIWKKQKIEEKKKPNFWYDLRWLSLTFFFHCWEFFPRIFSPKFFMFDQNFDQVFFLGKFFWLKKSNKFTLKKNSRQKYLRHF